MQRHDRIVNVFARFRIVVCALGKRVKYLGLLRVQGFIAALAPCAGLIAGTLAEQQRLCPVCRFLSVGRELQDFLALLVIRVAAARKHSCRALYGFLRLQAAERQQEAVKRLAQLLNHCHAACILALRSRNIGDTRNNRLNRQTRVACTCQRSERTGNKRNIRCNILCGCCYIVPCRFRLFRTEIILVNTVSHHFAQQVKDVRQCVAGQAAYKVVHHLDWVERTARTGQLFARIVEQVGHNEYLQQRRRCACRDLRLAPALRPQVVRNIAEQVVILVHNLQLEHGERLDERRLGLHDNRLCTSCAVADQSRRPAVSLLQRRLGAHMPLFHIVQIACAHHHLAG